MAILKESVIGVLSGKIGQVVGATWKGISVLKVLPGSIANPQTDAQLDQRQKFSVTMHFLQPLSEFLKTGFKSYAVKMTGINAAMSYNIRNAVSGAYPNYAIDYPNALVARGNLASALNQVATSTVAGTVKFDWQDNSGEIGASALDKTLLVVYNPHAEPGCHGERAYCPCRFDTNHHRPLLLHRRPCRVLHGLHHRRWADRSQQRLCRCRNRSLNGL